MITYPRFQHPDQPELFVQPILVSKPSNGARPIISLHAHYPRIIHGEVMTHRVFGRNARSSRAVPVKTMLNEVRTKPFVPWHWGANQKGMQAGSDCDEFIELKFGAAFRGFGLLTREEGWLRGRDQASEIAEAYMNAGYHKQIPNRLLEPFSWIDTLITTTSLANFFHLRDHKDAEPHFQDLARLVVQARDWIKKEGAFQTLDTGWWHLPFVTERDWDVADDWLHSRDTCSSHKTVVDLLKMISAARAARISYAPFDGDASYQRELERFNHLVSSDRIHASPLEHQASPDDFIDEYEGWANAHLAGNLGPGWIQFRKTIEGEYVEDEVWL